MISSSDSNNKLIFLDEETEAQEGSGPEQRGRTGE